MEEWVHLVHELRPEFSDTEVRTAVHAAMGLLQSPSDFQSGLAAEAAVNCSTCVRTATSPGLSPINPPSTATVRAFYAASQKR